MPRINLLPDEALPANTLAQVKAMEAAGKDTALTRGLANASEFFERYFAFGARLAQPCYARQALEAAHGHHGCTYRPWTFFLS